MTIDDFKLEVAGLLNRSPEALVVNGQDLILNAVNRARSTAQRMLDFERLRKSLEVTVSLTNGVDLSTAVLPGTATVVSINKIKRGYVKFTNGSIWPIEMTLKDLYLSRLGRKLSYDPKLRIPSDINRVTYPSVPVMYRQGNQLFLWPTDSNIWGTSSTALLGLDCIVKDLDYAGGMPTLVFQITMPTTGTGTGLEGPFPVSYSDAPVGPNTTQYSVPFTKVGTLRGYSLYYCAGSIFGGYPPVWLWFIPSGGLSYEGGGDPLVDQGGLTSFASNRWVISSAVGSTSSALWYSPLGIESLTTTSGWTPVSYAQASTALATCTFGLRSQSSSVDDVVAPFWLDECQEWLQLYTLQYLQTHFIKDSTRWPVTQQMVAAAWQGVVSWNDSISESEPDYDLD